MSQTVGSLAVDLSANIARFQEGMDRAAAIAEQRMGQVDKALSIVKTSLTAVGAGFAFGATFDAVKGKIEGAIQSAAGLQMLAERTGASVEALSGLASVAKLSNTSMDDLAAGMQKLNKSMVDAQNGGRLTAASFSAIGISTQDLKSKAPDEVFKSVAYRLAMYRDGAEKTVVAQNLLGKSGANLLPLMNELATAGDLQVKVTEDQARAAKELEDNQIRLRASSDAIFKKIGLELVPVLNDLTQSLLQVQEGNDGIRRSVDELATENKIRSWAQDAAMGLAILIESMQGVGKLTSSVAGSFNAVYADLKFSAQYLTTASYSEVQAALEQRNKVVEEANRRYADLWNFDSRFVEKDFAARFAASNAMADWASNADARDLRLIAAKNGASSKQRIQGAGLTSDDAEVKRYIQALQTLEQQLGRLNNQTEVEKIAYQTTQGSLNGLTEKHKAALVAVAGEIDMRNQHIQVLDAEQAHFSALYAVIQKGEEIRKGAAISAREQLQTYEFEVSLLGKSAAQVQILNAERQIELGLRAQLRAAAEAAGDNNAQYEKEVVRLERIAQTLRESLIPAMKARIEIERSAAFGTSEALRKYAEDASNGAKQMESLYTNAFKNMEDALVSFVRTGELDFSKLADSIIADLIRIQVQQSITGPLAEAMKGQGGLGGFIGGLFGGNSGEVAGTRAAGGPVSAGMPYLVGEHGPEILVPDTAGKVLPSGQGLSGGGLTYSPIIKIDARADRADVYMSVQRALQQNNEQFAGLLRQQGVLV